LAILFLKGRDEMVNNSKVLAPSLIPLQTGVDAFLQKWRVSTATTTVFESNYDYS
jgi:hypothetical protein